jgi:3-dehydroquinate dehydratase/shikimate dehydrogenase
MFIAVIQASDYDSAKQQLLTAQQVDGVELRLDYADSAFEIAARLRNECDLPMIFTLRKKSQGGFYQYSEEQRLNDLFNLCSLKPDYVDIEFDVPATFITKIKTHHPTIKLICSYHDFQKTPLDLTAILQTMHHDHFYAYKIATHANSSLDSLRMLIFIYSQHKDYNLTGICMGTPGMITRILSPVIGNIMHYVSIDKNYATAPGQLTFDELISVYHAHQLTHSTKIYALLGDPIDLSVGHILHNEAIRLLDQNAVYIKLLISAEELIPAISLCRKLPFNGFSITMPLKESIFSLVDTQDSTVQAIKALNTILVNQSHYTGFNTDGLGAINALADKLALSKQTIIILGAGGAARAIAYEALQKKAKVIIINRTINRAKQLALELGCDFADFNTSFKHYNYNVLINTLPESAYSNDLVKLLKTNLLPNTVAMDIVYQPIQTLFLQIAKDANCTCIPGYEMYIRQALLQITHWFKPDNKQLIMLQNKMRHFFAKQEA